MESTTNQNNGVRITIDEGVFFVSSKRVGKDNYRHEFMSRDGLKAIERAAELLGLKAEAHGEAVAEAFNRQQVETLEQEKAVLTEALIKAADVFDFYAKHHATKTVPDEEKARNNYKHRNMCRAAIASVSPAPCPHPSTITQHMGDGTPVSYCPKCGCTGIHACVGHKPKPWTDDERKQFRGALEQVPAAFVESEGGEL